MPQSKIEAAVLKEDLQEDRRLNLIIKVLSALFILLFIAFISYYSYSKYTQEQATPKQKAINQAVALIRKNPADTAARVRLGVLYTQAGSVDAAIKQFDEVLTMERDNQEALLYAGIAYLNLEKNGKIQYETALKYFNKEIRYYKNTAMAGANPSLEQAYYYGGIAYWKLKQNDKALDYFGKSLAIKAASSDTYLIMGRIYLEKKDYDMAKQAFEGALNLDPNYADALYGLGLAYEAKGDKSKALDNFKSAVKANPTFQKAKDAVARLDKNSKA